MYYKIERFCKEQNITISQMCSNLNISPQIITNLKKRTQQGQDAKLNVENVAKIADFIGISVSELIKKEGD